MPHGSTPPQLRPTCLAGYAARQKVGEAREGRTCRHTLTAFRRMCWMPSAGRFGLGGGGIGCVVVLLQFRALEMLVDVIEEGKREDLEGSQALGRLWLEAGLDHLHRLGAEISKPEEKGKGL